jgi:hypothetical protein
MFNFNKQPVVEREKNNQPKKKIADIIINLIDESAFDK